MSEYFIITLDVETVHIAGIEVLRRALTDTVTKLHTEQRINWTLEKAANGDDEIVPFRFHVRAIDIIAPEPPLPEEPAATLRAALVAETTRQGE